MFKAVDAESIVIFQVFDVGQVEFERQIARIHSLPIEFAS
jgi:hypothetical protein